MSEELYSQLEDECMVLRSIFPDDVIEFLECDIGDHNTDNLCTVKFKLDSRGEVWLELHVSDGYPSRPAAVRIRGSIEPMVSKHLLQVGNEIARMQADIKDVAAYAIYLKVKEAYDAMCPSIEPSAIFAVRADGCDAALLEEATCALSPLSDRSGSLSLRRGVSLRFLLRFAKENRVKGFEKFSSCCESTGELCYRVVVPATKEMRCTFTSLGEPHVYKTDISPPTCFISHAWQCSFASLVTALFVHQVGATASWELMESGALDIDRLWDRLRRYFSPQCDAIEHFYWIDVFDKNQHTITSEDTADELLHTVKSAAEVLLVLEPLMEPKMLMRVWCLYEISQALQLQTLIKGATSFSSMLQIDDIVMRQRTSNAERFHFRRHGVKRDYESTDEEHRDFAGTLRRILNACAAARSVAVGSIDIRYAQATVPSDRATIIKLIEEGIGVGQMNKSVKGMAESCIRRSQAAVLESWARAKGSPRWEAAAAVVAREEVETVV